VHHGRIFRHRADLHHVSLMRCAYRLRPQNFIPPPLHRHRANDSRVTRASVRRDGTALSRNKGDVLVACERRPFRVRRNSIRTRARSRILNHSARAHAAKTLPNPAASARARAAHRPYRSSITSGTITMPPALSWSIGPLTSSATSRCRSTGTSLGGWKTLSVYQDWSFDWLDGGRQMRMPMLSLLPMVVAIRSTAGPLRTDPCWAMLPSHYPQGRKWRRAAIIDARHSGGGGFRSPAIAAPPPRSRPMNPRGCRRPAASFADRSAPRTSCRHCGASAPSAIASRI